MASESTRAMFDAFHAELDAQSAKAAPVDVLAFLKQFTVPGEVVTDIDEYREAHDAVADLLDKADNALRLIANAISADQIGGGYVGIFNDLNNAINRVNGAA